MSFLARMKNVYKNPPHGTAPRSFKGFLVDKGERLGGSFALGYAKGKLGEKFIWRGHGYDLWGGLGAYLAAALVGGRAASHLERFGDVGVQGALMSLGASYGAQSAGRLVQVVSPGKNVRAMGPKTTALGYIAPAMGGAALDADAIANYAARR